MPCRLGVAQGPHRASGRSSRANLTHCSNWAQGKQTIERGHVGPVVVVAGVCSATTYVRTQRCGEKGSLPRQVSGGRNVFLRYSRTPSIATQREKAITGLRTGKPSIFERLKKRGKFTLFWGMFGQKTSPIRTTLNLARTFSLPGMGTNASAGGAPVGRGRRRARWATQ